MAKKEKKSKKSNGIKIDFTGVEARAAAHPEGRFAFAVEDVEVKTSENSGNDYLQWVLKSSKGKVYYITSLASHALWNLKSVLEAAGQDVPDGELEIDIDELKELEFGGEVVHEKYEGKTKGVIAEVFPVDEVEGDSEEEVGGDDEDGEEVTFESVQEMDLDELLELASDNDIKVTKKQQKDVDALRDFLCEKLDLEEEEEEEGEEPTYEEVQEMDEEDLDALVEEHELKIKAKDKKKIAKYRDAVCEALELEEGDEEEEEEEEEDTSSKKGKKGKK